MKRPRALWGLAAIVLLGCSGQRAGFDPFGRTTIPPPGTGAVGPPPPYYPNGAPAGAPAAAPAMIPMTAPAGAQPNLVPVPAGQPAVPRFAPPAATLPLGSTATPNPGLARWGPAGSSRLQPTSFDGVGPNAAAPVAAGSRETVAISTTTPVAPVSTVTPVAPSAGAPSATPGFASAAPPQVVVIDNVNTGPAAIHVGSPSLLAAFMPTGPQPELQPRATLPGEPQPLPAVAAQPLSAVQPAAVASTTPTQSGGLTWGAPGTAARRAAASAAPASNSAPARSAVPVSAVVPVSYTEASDAPPYQPSAQTTSSSIVGTPPIAARSTPTMTGGSPTSTQTAPATRSKYAHEADYSLLTGKLEYSAARQQWKLRYLPVDASDGQVDQYGGSVVLVDSPELKKFQDGDFVTVQGAIGQRDPNARDFAARYEIRQIQKADLSALRA